jgi:hypothetical protein
MAVILPNRCSGNSYGRAVWHLNVGDINGYQFAFPQLAIGHITLVQIRYVSDEADLAEWVGMRRQAVESTTMRSIGYDDRKQVLEVEFQSGRIYQYLEIPPAIYKELVDAESKGRYFNSEIRDSYEFVRVDRRQRGAAGR